MTYTLKVESQGDMSDHGPNFRNWIGTYSLEVEESNMSDRGCGYKVRAGRRTVWRWREMATRQIAVAITKSEYG